MNVTLSKGGTAERVVDSREIVIHDLWHIAGNLPDEKREKILDVWHLAHDLLRHIREGEE